MPFFAVLDNNFSDDKQAWIFEDPVEFIEARSAEEVQRALENLETARLQGFFAVGAIAYELGTIIDPAFASHIDNAQGPLLYFGVFKNRVSVSQKEIDTFLSEKCGVHAPFIAKLRNGIREEEYLKALTQAKRYLEAGDNYQVNYTFPTYFDIGGCLTAAYKDLRQSQAVKYGAFLHFPHLDLLSRSPELFFQKSGSRLETHPMKGTAKRAQSSDTDDTIKKNLVIDPKQRAENLMIVDLLRNDLSRIAKKGSVNVDALFVVETFKTVHQMISKISCEIDPNLTLKEILHALYPCGSITGAPKIRTSEIIKELEKTPRGFYTGAVGLITPENDMTFSVPIRTITVDQNRGGTMGIGSGVVYDSVGEREFEECLLKGQFLFNQVPDFNILESFYYAPEEGARNEKWHLKRMENAARDLRFEFDVRTLRDQLNDLYLTIFEPQKIRIELSKLGEFKVEATPLTSLGATKCVISDCKINGNDPVYRYKTTNRGLYNSEFQKARALGAMDVIFFNQQGFLTEAAIHNVFIKTEDAWKTPSLDCGLLNGVGRQIFIEENHVIESQISKEEFVNADEIWLVSSTRGRTKITLQT